jgi:glycosyltransferase involved in cell wall biosynthesis
VDSPAKISIVTPSLNQGSTIEETILSVLAQEDPDFEHIVIDGGSTDNTLLVLERFPHLRWVSEDDDGQTDAINKGLEMSTGEIVAYLNSDDVYRPDAFANVRTAFHENETSDVVVGSCDIIDAQSRTVGKYQARLDSRRFLPCFWLWEKNVCIPQPGVFIRRQALEQVGLFDDSYDMAMDFEMWLRLAEYSDFVILDETLAGFRIAPDTKSMTRRADMVLDCYRAAQSYVHFSSEPTRFRMELRREAAGHLLTIAEEHGERPDKSRSPAECVRVAAGIWPPILLSPRAWRIFAGTA